jgi:putative ABC transport system permease protein
MSRLMARIAGCVLWFSPQSFRAHYGRFVVDDLERALREERQRGGAMAMFGLWTRGLGDAVKTVARERRFMREGTRPSRPWADLGGDVKYALRGWRRSPGFSATVVLTLALGLGLASAIFAFADGYLFRPLPFPSSERAYLVSDPNAEIASALKASDVEALRQSSLAEYGFVEWSTAELNGDLVVADGRVPVTSASVSRGFRQVLKLPLVAGRDFSDDDHATGAPVVAWISDRLWRSAFHRDPNVIGTTIRIDRTRDVVSVLVAGILGPEVSSFELNNRPPDLVIPRRGPPVVRPTQLGFPIVLLPPTVTESQAAERIAATLQSVAPAADGRQRTVRLKSMFAIQVSGGRPTAKVFLAGAILVLLLASLNLLHLLVSRGVSRASEFATRAALGAGRWRVVRVFLVESLMFGACGVVVGLAIGRALSWWVASRLPQFPTKGRNLSLVPMLFDERAVAVAVTLGLTIAVAGGLWPALLAIRRPLARQERADGRVRGTVSGRLARTMMISELTVASILIIGAVFVGLGVYRYLNQPLGFQLKDRFQVNAAQPDGRLVSGADAFAAAEAIRHVTGVSSAALRHVGAFTPVSVPPSSIDITTQLAPGDRLGVPTYAVNSGYFDAWGITIRKGRPFVASEHPDNGSLAMVTDRLAQRLWPGVDPIGQTIKAAGSLRVVIGVIEGLRWQLDIEPETAVYVPALDQKGTTYLVAHVPGGTLETIGPQLTAAVERAVPSAIVSVKAVTAGSMLERGAGEARFQGPVVLIFGLLAIILAGIGVFGLVSYLVEQRTREFGIRMALGAKVKDIWRTVMRESIQPTLIGLVLGSAGALALESVVQSSVFGWKSSGLTAVAIVAVGLLAVAIVAAVIPAGRAARVDPATTLRTE